MPEAFGKALSTGQIEFESAGTMPSPEINPVVVEAIREKGIDVAGGRPKLLKYDMAEAADRVFTMGCSIDDACPGSAASAEEWALDDPTGKDIEEVRRIRD